MEFEQQAQEYSETLSAILQTMPFEEAEAFFVEESQHPEYRHYAAYSDWAAKLTFESLLSQNLEIHAKLEENQDFSGDEFELASTSSPDSKQELSTTNEITLKARDLIQKVTKIIDTSNPKVVENNIFGALILNDVNKYLYSPDNYLALIKAIKAEGEFVSINGEVVSIAWYVAKSVELELEKNWQKKLTADHLAAYVRLSAEFDEEIAGTSGYLLQKYFAAPRSFRERIFARRQLAFAALKLIDDPASLLQAILIGTFQTEALTRDQGYLESFYAATRYGINEDGEIDDESLTNAWSTNTVFRELCRLTTLVEEDIFSDEFLYTKTDSFIEFNDQLIKKHVKKYGAEGFRTLTNRRKILDDISKTQTLVLTPEHNSVWPYTAIFHPNDLLKRELTEKVQPYLFALGRVDQIKAEMKRQDPKSQPRSLTIRVSEMPYSIDIVVEDPKMAIDSLDRIIEIIRNSKIINPEILMKYTPQGFTVSGISQGFIDGKQFVFWFRQHASMEKTIHPIGTLASIGLPEINTEGKTLNEYSETLAKSVFSRQSVFLGLVGIRGPITEPKLRARGFRAAQFREDPKDNRRTIATLVVGEGENPLRYEVALDQNFRIDLQGMELDSLESHKFVLTLQAILLQMIQEIVCYEFDDLDEQFSIPEYDKVARIFNGVMGHMRFLAKGSATDRARRYYDKERNAASDPLNTLDSESEKRKRVHNTTRNSTYRRSTVGEDKNPKLRRLGKVKLKNGLP